MEEEAGLRIRTKYQELEAQKQEKRLVFTGGSIPPMKRLRVNGCKSIPFGHTSILSKVVHRGKELSSKIAV